MKKVKNWDRYEEVMGNAPEFVRFGEDDKPNKYGDTKKMLAIYDIVENEKDPDEADFEWDDPSIMFYLYNLRNYLDAKEACGGKKPVIVHYIND